MIAFKWLQRGALAPFTGFRWQRGAWVAADPDAPEGFGIHACRAGDLPYWVSDELWRLELEGPLFESETQIEGRRGRLLSQVERWDPMAYARACALHAGAACSERLAACTSLDEMSSAAAALPTHLVAYLQDACRRAAAGLAGPASFISAVAAVAATGRQSAFAEERAWQARWLAEELGLQP